MEVRSSPSIPPQPLVGRDRELSLLRKLLAAAHQGHGSLVLIEGEAGVGKSALAGAIFREAADGGSHALISYCYDRIETAPYGPWLQIAGRLEVFFPSRHPASHSLDGSASQAAFFAQTRALIAEAAADRPLVLLLEDFHWADRASLDLLRFISHELAELPLLLMTTYRGEAVGSAHPLSGMIPLLVREAPTERLNLRPLDARAVQTLVRARYDLGERSAQHFAEHLIDRTEGNALFLTELLRSLDEAGGVDGQDVQYFVNALRDVPVPTLLKQIVDERLNRLGDAISATLPVAAVIGQEVPLPVWKAVAQADEETLLGVVEEAEGAHLVVAWPNGQGIRFTHALIRDVLYEHVPALRRRRLHQQVAEALMALPAPDPDSVASHLQQAGDVRVAEWLVRAAERAEDAYALVTAAERYDAAIALLDAQNGDATERAWLRLLAAALLRYQDQDRAFAWAKEAVGLAAEIGDPGLSARAQAMFGLLVMYRGEYRAAATSLADAADSIDRLPSANSVRNRREQQIDKLANRGMLVLALAYGGRLTEARIQGESYCTQTSASQPTPAALGALAAVHQGLALAYAHQGEPELAQRSYAAAISAFQASDNHVLAHGNLRSELICVVLPYRADDLAERERVANAAERMAEWVVAHGGHADSNLPRYARIPLLVLEGDWGLARHLLDQPRTADSGMIRRVRPLYRGMLARAQGDIEIAWRCVHEPSLVHPGTEPGEGVGGWQLLSFQRLAAELALDAGELPAARRWLDLHRRWLEFMDMTLGRSEAAVLEAQWHRAAGNLAHAQEHAARALACAMAPRQPLALLAAHRMLGNVFADAGNRMAAEEQFAQALALADACRAPYERALTLIARADLFVATGNRHRASSLLVEARAICLPMDARPALTRIDRLAAQLQGASEIPPAGLSPRELEVLRLVAAGLSNAQIAERLFVSPNTVRVHVASILAKIGVPNRATATEFAIRNGLA
jgi:DNA-binding CsgD family transcriptional regulator